MKCNKFFIKFFIYYIFSFSFFAFEIIRDTELEQFTDDIVSILLKSNDLDVDDLNIYFVKSDQINAFVTGGKNIFINTETIIDSK